MPREPTGSKRLPWGVVDSLNSEGSDNGTECLLFAQLQEAQLYKSVFLSAVGVWLDLAWKNSLPLSSCDGNKVWTLQPLTQALLYISSADDHPPIARAVKDMKVQPGEPVMLRGTESTDDHGIVSYEWKQILGDPSAEMKVGSCRE